MPLFETSAKDDEKTDHVEAIFVTLAHKIATFNKPLMEADKNSIGKQNSISKQQSAKRATSKTSLLREEEKPRYTCYYIS